MRWTSLTPEENERAVAALRKLLEEHRSQGELATTLVMPSGKQVTQQVVSAVLNGNKPVGVAFARVIAAASGVTFDELVSGRRSSRGDGYQTNQQLKGWTKAAIEAVEKRLAPRYAILAAGELPVSVRPEDVTPEFVQRVALLWLRHAPVADRIAAERAELDEQLMLEAAAAEEAANRPVEKSEERGRADARVVEKPTIPQRRASK
jgi:hypothetical protein